MSILTPTTSSSFDPGNLNLSYRGAFQRPDCIGNTGIANAGTGSMFNINAFNAVPSGAIGNCGVGILECPGTTTIAAGLAKNFHITERVRLRFEGTFTNLLNHPKLCSASHECHGVIVRPSPECSNRRKQRKPNWPAFIAV
jgi:hypothetical protein